MKRLINELNVLGPSNETNLKTNKVCLLVELSLVKERVS